MLKSLFSSKCGFLILAVCCLLQTLPSRAEDIVLRKAVEFTPRGGLPNFFGKLEAGKAVTVAYLGGSITAQNGWRVQSQQWLEEQYPQATIKGIHAAIGGTGSDLGVFRVEKDALVHKPDLLFVEFAVNDLGTNPENLIKAMEGIVRKTWKANPETDICFVYTMTFRESQALAAGQMHRAASVMEAIADHYGIPSIHMGYQAALLEKEGKLVMKSDDGTTKLSLDKPIETASAVTAPIIFSKDGVHPHPDTGHVLYTQALIRSLNQIKDKTGVNPHSLVTPMRADNLESARQYPIDAKYLSGPYTDLRKAGETKFAKEMPQLFRMDPGATLSFKFKGTGVGIYDLLAYDGSEVEITIDGETKKQTRMDGHSTTQRPSRLGISFNLEDKTHEVTVRVLDTKLDKREILYEGKRGDYDANPEKYAPHYWYPAAIFIVGEMVE
jgi:lysophospholipase L1-like esterase